MFRKIGAKLAQGAKTELEENPPELLTPDTLTQITENLATAGLMGLMIFGMIRGGKAKPVTVIVNNYINGILQK